MVFVRAESGAPLAGDPDSMFTVKYFDENGDLTIRSGGTRAWRCNNPGNLRKFPYSMSKSRRAIGFAGAEKDFYAVYPDYETGHEALIVMLKGSVYSPLSLRAAIRRYDGTNPKYIDAIVEITKLDPERTIKSLTNEEFECFWKAIEFIEKWRLGEEDFIKKCHISGVHKKRGVITEYLVNQSDRSTWIAKPQAIQLALENRLHAVLVHTKTGTIFLRPERHCKPFELIA